MKPMSTDREASSVMSLTAAAGRQRDHVNFINHVSGLIPALNKFACIIALVLFVVLPAHAQQTADDVQKQIQQLKEQYERTTRELQERIAALEQQQKSQSESKQDQPAKAGGVSAVAAAAQDAANTAFGQSKDKQALQGKVPAAPMYDQLR